MNPYALYLLADITSFLGKASTALFFAAVLAACIGILATAALRDAADVIDHAPRTGITTWHDHDLSACQLHPDECDPDTTDCPGCATGEARCTCGQRPICHTHQGAPS